MKKRLLRKLVPFLLSAILVSSFTCCTTNSNIVNPSTENLSDGTSTAVVKSDTDISSDFSTDALMDEPTDETWTSSLEYPWDVPTDSSKRPAPYVGLGGRVYYVRNNTAEVESLSDVWEYVGTVTVSVSRDQETVDAGWDHGGIASNCMPIGAKVYQWQYLLAVEYEDFYVIFKDSSVG